MKKAITEELVLELLDLNEPFKLHIDAFDFSIGGVLMQEGHRIDFESPKLNDTKKWYTVQEKEMTAVMYWHCTWRHYSLMITFIIKTNNITTSYFQTQENLTPKQAG